MYSRHHIRDRNVLFNGINMPAFNHRIRPKERFGISAVLFDYGAAGLILLVFGIFPVLPLRVVCLTAAPLCIAIAVYGGIHHKDSLLLRAKWMSRRESRCYSKESLIEM